MMHARFVQKTNNLDNLVVMISISYSMPHCDTFLNCEINSLIIGSLGQNGKRSGRPPCLIGFIGSIG